MYTKDEIRESLQDFARSLGDKVYRIPIDPGDGRGDKPDEFWIVNGHGVGIIILADDESPNLEELTTLMKKIHAANGSALTVSGSIDDSFDWFKFFIDKLLNNPFVE